MTQDLRKVNKPNTKIKNLKPSKVGRYKQGYIDPRSCKKLFPNISNDIIIYRSSYERAFIYWLENNNNIKYWGSECFSIKYYSLLDNKMHNYYPDYFIEFINSEKMVVEVKPYNQTQKPVNENNWLYKEYIKNMCKWKAMKEYCDARGFKFKIITENTIDKLY